MQGDSKSLGVTKSINNSIAKKMKKVEGRAALGPKTAARRFRLDTGKALDLNAVQIFASAARAGSLSEAAKELALPASTVSRSLTRLEKQLGLLLVRRGQRGLLLTDAGSEYLKLCAEGLHILRNARELLDKNRANPRGVLKVACPILMTRDVIAPLLRPFVDSQPELRVEIRSYSPPWDQEPKEDIDIFFKIRAPRDPSGEYTITLRLNEPYMPASRMCASTDIRMTLWIFRITSALGHWTSRFMPVGS